MTTVPPEMEETHSRKQSSQSAEGLLSLLSAPYSYQHSQWLHGEVFMSATKTAKSDWCPL